MVEVYYNSGQFPATMKLLEKKFARPSEIFTSLAEYYEKNGLTGISHSRLARYEILYRFLEEKEVKVEQSLSLIHICVRWVQTRSSRRERRDGSKRP